MTQDNKFYFSVFWQLLQRENLDGNEIMYMKHPDLLRIQVLGRCRKISHSALLCDLFLSAKVFLKIQYFYFRKQNFKLT